jgi:hypothetical protein
MFRLRPTLPAKEKARWLSAGGLLDSDLAVSDQAMERRRHGFAMMMVMAVMAVALHLGLSLCKLLNFVKRSLSEFVVREALQMHNDACLHVIGFWPLLFCSRPPALLELSLQVR